MDVLYCFFHDQIRKECSNICNKNDETPLHIAARSKKANVVKRLLNAGADANALDSRGNTPLHSAVKAKAVAAVKILLRHSATDVNARTPAGDTPLILATSYMRKKQQLLVDLINAGADVNAADNTGKTALHWAAELDYISKLDLLLKHGANKIAQDRQCRTPLHLAALSNGANAVKRLLEVGVEANLPDIKGRTSLHLAAEVTASAAANVLLRHSATDVNARTTDDVTPLLCASSRAFLSRKKQLLAVNLINAGADVNAKDCSGDTALHFATMYECLILMDALLQNGANVNAQNSKGRTPLHCVSTEDVCKKLLDAGADANVEDNNGCTPLHLNVIEEDLLTFRTLLPHTTNLNSRMNKDITPLISAVFTGLVDIVIDLINANADVNTADNRGKTALHWASDFSGLVESKLEDYFEEDVGTRRAHIARHLLDSGADVNAKDNLGNTPLHIAIESEALSVFEVLLRHRATDLDARRTSDGKTALMILLESASTLEEYILEEHGYQNLINAGADITVMDYRGRTVLHYAAKWDDAEATELLIKHGADVNFADKVGMTALHISVESNAWAVFEVLLMHPAIDLNVHRINDGKTPLIMMVESDPDIDDFEDLIEAGADVSATDYEGKTALHYAAKLDKTAEMSALLVFRANPDVQDRKGQTPLHLAAGEGSFNACRLLVAELFADRYIIDNRGKLPRDIASERDHEDIVILLNDFMPAG